MRNSLRLELGDRACRSMVMENTGRRSRRSWWIVSSDVLAECSRVS